MRCYVMRFLLGLAEAGFYPGIILYLTYWYPRAAPMRAVGFAVVAASSHNVVLLVVFLSMAAAGVLVIGAIAVLRTPPELVNK